MKTYKKLLFGSVVFLILYFGLLIIFQSGLVGSSARKIDDIESKGLSFDELHVPDDIKVVGIGEATHGNCEFQTVKLEVLQKQVETGKCHSIAFEMTAGEAAEINDAIHDQDSDLYEIVSRSNYPIYDTEQIVELLTWMRDYNKDKTYEESLMFYGVDMQGPYREIPYLATFADNNPEILDENDKETLHSLEATLETDDYSLVDENREFFVSLSEKLLAEDDLRAKNAGIIANSLVQWIDAPSFEEDSQSYGEHRDLCMAKNLKSEYELEVERGYSQIIITAHNGHVMKGDTLGYGEVAMGARIDELFEGSYFCIGTDFYNGVVNIHTQGTFEEEYERADHEFCSDGILSYQAKFFDEGRYCLDFTKLTPDDGKVYKLVHSDTFMGLAGEGYNANSDIYKGYRQKMIQADRFDAVIYYYNVTPIRPIDY